MVDNPGDEDHPPLGGATAGSSATSASPPVGGAQAGRDMATGLVSAAGSVLENTVHVVGNVVVTTMLELTRVLATTAVGVRHTIASAVSGNPPNYAELQQREADYRRSQMTL